MHLELTWIEKAAKRQSLTQLLLALVALGIVGLTLFANRDYKP